MRDYSRVHSTFWTSPDTSSLSEDGRLLALYLLTGPHSNMLGAFRLPIGYVSTDINWSFERVSKGLKELSDSGFITLDSASQWVCITNYLRFNQIENPNQAKSLIKLIDQVPKTSPVLSVVSASVRKFSRFVPDELDHVISSGGLIGASANPSKGVPEGFAKPFPNQDQDQDQENNSTCAQPGPSTSNVVKINSKKDAPPYQDIIDLYHEILKALPKVYKLTETRKQRIRALWSDELDTLDSWKNYFTFIAQSAFLMGRSPPGRDGRVWAADFDFIINAQNFVKIAEKKYHGSRKDV
ncbi:hypothetical protein [Candidatus Methylomicrobium oryzae]|uniref:hypothetical protein n=1 Tax=Candidatus Methylomicrobium oryzae TaxID=2802053 RepID=UPI00192101CB|nr:hypothetical protein [Methylomicrobium sp. RS1]MBL1265725.1 hypothetical protein [Methylomicrobium sp. RS1]